jgi:nucleoside-diphosphate-sugar epimerase
MTRVLVTGATGFIGAALCEAVAQAGYQVRAALRSGRSIPNAAVEHVVVGDINSTCDWSAALEGVDAVLHAAARVHMAHDGADSQALYAETNERGTQCLASAAARAKVRRFVYLSSVKVNGEETRDRAYTPFDEPHPQGAYGISKWHAEKHIMQIAALSCMETTIVRAPLVYGPGVRANFLRLLRLVDRGWPLPLGAVHNKRSLVNIWNLCDLLVHVLRHPSAPGHTWMVSDAEDLSTVNLLRRIGDAMDRQVRLFSVPVGLVQLCAGLVGRRAEITRLCSSLTVDITHTRAALGWTPPVTVEQALARTVAWYLREGRLREA